MDCLPTSSCSDALRPHRPSPQIQERSEHEMRSPRQQAGPFFPLDRGGFASGGQAVAESFINNWVNRLKAGAREEIEETARSALSYLVLYGMTAVAALLALIFFTLAVFWWLAAQLSAITAALIITAFYAVTATVLFLWASWSDEPRQITGAPTGVETATVEETEPQRPAGALDLNFDGVARTLADAGFRTESLIVSASSELARHLTPLQLMALVFVGSFLFGCRLRRR